MPVTFVRLILLKENLSIFISRKYLYHVVAFVHKNASLRTFIVLQDFAVSTCNFMTKVFRLVNYCGENKKIH